VADIWGRREANASTWPITLVTFAIMVRCRSTHLFADGPWGWVRAFRRCRDCSTKKPRRGHQGHEEGNHALRAKAAILAVFVTLVVLALPFSVIKKSHADPSAVRWAWAADQSDVAALADGVPGTERQISFTR
jgi:hypothetical protein